MSKRWIVALTVLGVVVAAGAMAFLWSPASHPRAGVPDGGAPATVAATGGLPGGLASWRVNGAGGRYVAPVLDGAAPAVRTLGTVRTDTDCTPDAAGLSHCHNRIELASGGTLTIQDNHDMKVNPCLSPGDAVSVEPLREGWVEIHKRAGV